jgi:hypothetical protein
LSEAQAISAAIVQSDYFRGSAAGIGGGAHKEWQHFIILDAAFDLLVNFSWLDEVRPGAPPGSVFPRIVLLVRDHEWDGDVETFALREAHVVDGQLAADYRGNRLAFDDGAFRLEVRLQERPVALQLTLTPVTMPAYVPNVAMLDGPPMNWVVVPRLSAEGVLRVGARDYRLDGVPAYHDHNWGTFLWGNDISWEWGFVLPQRASIPWSMTFVRLTNRSRTVALMQNLLLWRGAHLVAIFRAREVAVRTALEHLQPRRVFKVPRVMALLAPEQSTDVPASWGLAARRGGNWVDVECEGREVAQVLIPSETRLGVTIFNEVSARSTVRGSFGGEAFAFEGRSIMEFIRG